MRFIDRFFGRKKRSVSKTVRSSRRGAFDSWLRLELLEERALLHGVAAASAAAPATHFALYASQNVVAGSPAGLEVVALDASNHVVRDYTGTVSLGSTGTGDTLPASYTFTSSDHGAHLFSVTLATGGSPDTITATDTATPPDTGSITVNVNPAPVATHFAVLAKANATVGTSDSVLVVALDASNHPVPNFTGTVTLTDTTDTTVAPVSYQFQASDHGAHVFQVTFNSTGSQVLSASDTATPPDTGTITINVNPAPVATHFAVLANPNATVGTPDSVLVVALDASNRPVPNFTGTVTLTDTTDTTVAPASYTFQAGDHGTHVFQMTFNSTGAQVLSATDTATPPDTGTITINVNPAQVATQLFVLAPQNAIEGKQVPVLVAALDSANHLVTGYTGTVTLTDTSDATVAPITYTFQASDHGVHIFWVTLNTSGTQTLTATDGNGLKGTASVNVIVPPSHTSGSGSTGGSGGSQTPGGPTITAVAANQGRRR
ncbi:MAG TPA: hypothetical protein VHC22_25865 [Pirellulales bacterium]|nr:hypothetical protein [Pirellulales bacterium]